MYGLAATLYRLATAHIPASALDRQSGAAVIAPRQHNPSISKAVSDAILDGLELQPGHRPATIDAFTQRLGIADPPRGRTVLLTSMPATAARADVGTVRPPLDDGLAPALAALGAVEAPSPPPAPAPDPEPDWRPATPEDHTEMVARRPALAAPPVAAPVLRPGDGSRSPTVQPTQGPGPHGGPSRARRPRRRPLRCPGPTSAPPRRTRRRHSWATPRGREAVACSVRCSSPVWRSPPPRPSP